MRFSNAMAGALLAALLAGGCASMRPEARQYHVSSLLSYLYPDSTQVAPPESALVAEIRVPVRLGIAFVPDHNDALTRLSERDRMKLAESVRESFVHYPFIASIQTVPSEYLEAAGGFANLEQIASMLQLDLVALVSYDQVQNSDATGWSFLYWTGIGAYTIEGDRYDILTVVDTAVFDIKSRRLLMRADGTSKAAGTATWVGFSKSARDARSQGFEDACRTMIAALHAELSAFRDRAPQDPSIRLIIPPGYKPEANLPATSAG
jgi:rhombotail lipoprotein